MRNYFLNCSNMVYGINNKLLTWLTSFLVDRVQTVREGGSYSDWSSVLSGVPQGSVLGPILFIIYINDLSSSCPDLHSLYLFADDAKCFASIRSSSDCLLFQSSLDSITNWSNLWQLNLAADKCQIISFSYLKASTSYNYFVNAVPFIRVNEVVDLGVEFSQDLSFSPHIKDVCSRARRKASIILNYFKSRNRMVLFKAFATFVRPLLDYCSNLWCPFRKSEIDLIESIQRSFTKRLNGMTELQYSERLTLLGTESLEKRRLTHDLCMYYKIIFELIDLPIDDFFCFRTGITRNNGLCIYQNSFRSNAERYYFKNRCIRSWNLLPSYIVKSTTLNTFKRGSATIDLSKHLRTNYDYAM